MTTGENDIIDLTDSFTLVDHCDLGNVVIIDLNESTDNSSSVPSRKSSKRKTTTPKPKEQVLSPKILEKSKRSNGFGHCPICWDDLGSNPLASTKCGHVYCMKCLEISLRKEKRCPTCRRILKGVSAYHPLYIARR